MEVGCIYSIRNTSNGKEYIGQTRHDPRRRFQVHKSTARGHSRRGFSVLHRAMQIHGEAAFVLEVVEADVPVARLDLRERHWIRERCSLVPCGYNVERGGITNRDRGPLFAAKMSRAHRGKRHSAQWRANQSEAMRRMYAERRNSWSSGPPREFLARIETAKRLSAAPPSRSAARAVGYFLRSRVGPKSSGWKWTTSQRGIEILIHRGLLRVIRAIQAARPRKKGYRFSAATRARMSATWKRKRAEERAA